jgi:hypothetical protein
MCPVFFGLGAGLAFVEHETGDHDSPDGEGGRMRVLAVALGGTVSVEVSGPLTGRTSVGPADQRSTGIQGRAAGAPATSPQSR